jgi:hypothetical protein
LNTSWKAGFASKKRSVFESWLEPEAYKAKDSPWDAVLMGSVVSTVNAKIQKGQLDTKK